MQGRSSIAWPICSARLHIRSSSGHATRHANRVGDMGMNGGEGTGKQACVSFIARVEDELQSISLARGPCHGIMRHC